jgi:hypothetical protein
MTIFRCSGSRLFRLLVTLPLAAIVPAVTGCAALQSSAPGCQALQRVALVAQSVPTASFVPCLGQLPPGWAVSSLQVQRGVTDFLMQSDRASGHPVRVRLTMQCNLAGAVPTAPRAPGVRTYLRLRSIEPRYAGALYDEFPGGCVSYQFDVQRGPHIALIQDFESAVTLMSRQQLRLQLHQKFDLELDP